MIEPLHAALVTINDLKERFVALGGVVPDQWKGVPPKQLADAIRLAEAKERNNCHEIVFSMLKGERGAVNVTPLQAYFLACRCRCAMDTLDILSIPRSEEHKAPPILTELDPGWSVDDVIHWLLDSVWDHRHDIWLKLTAFGIVIGNPYYSG